MHPVSVESKDCVQILKSASLAFPVQSHVFNITLPHTSEISVNNSSQSAQFSGHGCQVVPRHLFTCGALCKHGEMMM